jgi:SAM-dependent methyltransferase
MYDQAYYAARYRYHPLTVYFWSTRYYARLLQRELPAASAARPRVLEIGCGIGHAVRHLSKTCDAYGLDISAAALRQARQVAPTATLLQASAARLPFASQTFDGALARHVLEHLAEPQAALTELRRVLRPGAPLIAAMPNPASATRPLKGARWIGWRDPTHVSLLTPDQWQQLFEQSGFTVLRRFSDGFWDVPYLPLVPSLLQLPLFGLPAALQVLSAGSFLPVRFGESVIFTVRAGDTVQASRV